MKSDRQKAILEIIEQQSIETQDDMLQALNARGFFSTQATVSRDIKELHITKQLSPNGNYRYTVSKDVPISSFSDRLNTVFKESVIKIDFAQNIVVINTLPGMANAACSALDSLQLPQIVGTLAGDDTAFLLTKDTASAMEFCNEIKSRFR